MPQKKKLLQFLKKILAQSNINIKDSNFRILGTNRQPL